MKAKAIKRLMFVFSLEDGIVHQTNQISRFYQLFIQNKYFQIKSKLIFMIN